MDQSVDLQNLRIWGSGEKYRNLCIFVRGEEIYLGSSKGFCQESKHLGMEAPLPFVNHPVAQPVHLYVVYPWKVFRLDGKEMEFCTLEEENRFLIIPLDLVHPW